MSDDTDTRKHDPQRYARCSEPFETKEQEVEAVRDFVAAAYRTEVAPALKALSVEK